MDGADQGFLDPEGGLFQALFEKLAANPLGEFGSRFAGEGGRNEATGAAC